MTSQRYLDIERRTKRRAMMRSYMGSAIREPLTAPIRGLRYLLKDGRDREE